MFKQIDEMDKIQIIWRIDRTIVKDGTIERTSHSNMDYAIRENLIRKGEDSFVTRF